MGDLDSLMWEFGVLLAASSLLGTSRARSAASLQHTALDSKKRPDVVETPGTAAVYRSGPGAVEVTLAGGEGSHEVSKSLEKPERQFRNTLEQFQALAD